MNTGTTRPLARKTCERLVPEAALGILVVARGREGIVAVLGNQQHAVDGQLARAQGQGVGNVVVDRKTVRRGQQPAGVVGRLLVGVQRRQPQAGELALAVERIGQQQAADDHVGVRVVAILGDDGGHGFGGSIVGLGAGREHCQHGHDQA